MKNYSHSYLKNKVFIILVSLLIGSSLLSCVNKELKKCENLIWRNQGKMAAMEGKPLDYFNNLKQMCQPYKTPINQAAYTEGYDLGLSVFCQKGRGFVFGKKGEVYNSTCKPLGEVEFLAGYYRGRISFLNKRQKELTSLLRQAEDRVWRKEQDYIIESTQDLFQAEQELDILESYKEEVKVLALEAKEIKLELIKLRKRKAELKFK